MYNTMKPQRGKTPGTAKRPAPRRPAPKPPAQGTDPVEVYCRIRPPEDPNRSLCCKVTGPDTVTLTATENSNAMRNGGIMKETKHMFKQVFDEFSPQNAVFEQVALPLVEDVLHGKNGLLFAYGVTSSGKTYTMMGEPQDPGVLPRCLDVIFNSIAKLQTKKYIFKPDKMNGFDVHSDADAMLERQRRELMPKLTNLNGPKTAGLRDRDDGLFDTNKRHRDTAIVGDVDEDLGYAVFLSYIEIYNKYTYDLLEEVQYDPIMGTKPPVSKALREDNEHNMYVSGAVEVEVKSTDEAYEVLTKGQKRRRVGHTSLNTESSRSHSVLNIRVVQAPLDKDGRDVMQERDKVCVSQLSLVDLAGSERAHRTGNMGDRLREAGNINNALMTLRSCIECLRENQQNQKKQMVPYRDDRLTHLFKNYFEGEGKVKMIVCINPLGSEYDETINVMKFAELTQEVQVARSQTVQFDVGLARGRRQLREKYIEDMEINQKEAGAPEAPMSVPLLYSLGPPFPSLQLLGADDDETLPRLAKYLEVHRKNQRKLLIADIMKKEAEFRCQLLQLEQEHGSFRERNSELENLVQGKDSEISALERRIRGLEKVNDTLSRKNTTIARKKESLEKEIGEKEWQIHMANTEKQRMYDDQRSKMMWMERNYNKKMEATKTQLVQESKAQIQAQRHKLNKVRNLLDSDTDSLSSHVSAGSQVSAGTPRGPVSRYMSARIFPAKSTPDLSSMEAGPSSSGVPTPAPRTHHQRAQTTAAALPTTRSSTLRTARGRSPPPTKPKPSMSLRYHRRSKSAQDKWLDHNPSGSVDTMSVLQPNIKKRKSVTCLAERDTRGVDKYLLTHQGLDSEGEMATKLIKGDILRTSGGGKAVIFNDVEVLKHKSPGDRKRKSNEDYPMDHDSDWTDTEERCRIAIENHGHMKRTKSSQV